MSLHSIRRPKKAQALAEILIAVAVGVVLFTVGASLIGPAIKISTQTERGATASELQQGLLGNLAAWANGDWTSVLALATSSAHQYHLLTARSPFVATSGVESLAIGSTTFTRYFYVNDVFRDSGGSIVTSGGTDDPDTKQFTVVVSWPEGSTTTASELVTRHGENSYQQTDWTGGSGANGPVSLVGTQFADSANINYTSDPGSLLIATTTTVGSGAISSSTYAHWGWNDLIGWINLWNNGTAGVTSEGLTGYASSSAGAISFDCHTTSIGNICGQSDYQVTNDGKGDLAGWAWNDAYGWISFEGPGYEVTVDASGTFHGFAWNDLAGWISFNCADYNGCGKSNYDAETAWSPSASVRGYLDSATFDTRSPSAELLNVLFAGYEPAGTIVEFQFAVSNASSGPWDYTGPDGTPMSFWVPLAPGMPLTLSHAYMGFRYFRYRIFLVGTNQTSTVRVDSVTVNWSP